MVAKSVQNHEECAVEGCTGLSKCRRPPPIHATVTRLHAVDVAVHSHCKAGHGLGHLAALAAAPACEDDVPTEGVIEEKTVVDEVLHCGRPRRLGEYLLELRIEVHEEVHCHVCASFHFAADVLLHHRHASRQLHLWRLLLFLQDLAILCRRRASCLLLLSRLQGSDGNLGIGRGGHCEAPLPDRLCANDDVGFLLLLLLDSGRQPFAALVSNHTLEQVINSDVTL
mmetsp:Transcript_18519/g.71502  ORF Transcript_18519/g.71502 Transcript_18519/m.71502 type:complete len:226 (+) Transcript_18519:1673-2350(+)